MNIVRSYKLQKLGIAIPEKDKQVIEFLDQKFNNLFKVHLKDYPNSMFYFNESDELIFEISKYKMNVLYVRSKNLWTILKSEYSLTYDEIKNIITFLIEKKYYLKLVTTEKLTPDYTYMIEKVYLNNKR